ncbi:hypothetical protein [Paenibacillus tyrfis]|uniref:hypothetical protein n=1 Tax=Paenibacillus tyrfis TaxID=1501230 RepID=UPI000B59369A|nr:hypothetical protein [Paenibacillus tyrfis]
MKCKQNMRQRERPIEELQREVSHSFLEQLMHHRRFPDEGSAAMVTATSTRTRGIRRRLRR